MYEINYTQKNNAGVVLLKKNLHTAPSRSKKGLRSGRVAIPVIITFPLPNINKLIFCRLKLCLFRFVDAGLLYLRKCVPSRLMEMRIRSAGNASDLSCEPSSWHELSRISWFRCPNS